MNSSLAAKTKSEPANGSYQFSMKTPGDIIGQIYDFSDATNWVIDNSGVAGAGWQITDQGPSGFFSGGMGAINSTSGGDFALFDADGNTGTGYIQLANPLNFENETNVAVEFESYYRNFQGAAYFEVSNDNGTSWETFQVHSSLPSNENTTNPQVVSINISNVAANEISVLFRFRYDSADDYAWMVDDLAFVVGYDDNLVLDNVYLSAGVDALDYYQVPVDQIQGFTFGADIDNIGVNNQTNTVLNIKVNDGTSDIYDENSTGITVGAFNSDSLDVQTMFTPPGIGDYTVTYDVSSDSTDQDIASNSIVLEPIIVGGNVYARDNGIPRGSVGYFGTDPVPSRMGQYFHFVNDFTITEVQMGISGNSEAGESVYAEIRVLNPDGTSFDFVAGSDPYDLQASELGEIISVPLLGDGYEVEAGALVEVLAGHFGSPDVRFLSAQTGVGAVVYDDQDQRFAQNSLFMVRPVSGVASTEEVSSNMFGVSIYPNPVQDEMTMKYKITNTSDVQVQITDVSGKEINTISYNSVQKGENIISINTSSLKAGVYLINIKSDGGSATKRFVVQ